MQLMPTYLFMLIENVDSDVFGQAVSVEYMCVLQKLPEYPGYAKVLILIVAEIFLNVLDTFIMTKRKTD